MKIRRLAAGTINRIAAGEVVERPASVVKELVENALDARATRIEIATARGGADLILVEDNGDGMDAEDLAVSVERHATSKLPMGDIGTDDLSRILTMGFRGEALPSIGAVARLSIASRTCQGQAHEIRVEGGTSGSVAPAGFLAPGQSGTRVEVRELFFATPARLKFLKTVRSEDLAIVDVVKRLAMARPDVGFFLTADGKRVLDLAAETDLFQGRLNRLARIMGRVFAENAVSVDTAREGVRVKGYAGLPTYNRSSGGMQFLFVNSRPVRDRLLVGAVRGAYTDFLARDRHPALALFIECDPEFVDVNVHPAKSEVRFRDANLVRALIVGSLKAALAEAGHRASTDLSHSALKALKPEVSVFHNDVRSPGQQISGVFEAAREFQAPLPGSTATVRARVEERSPLSEAAPLGAARAQIRDTYIVAETPDGIVIVDQHAAHERLLYERMKQAMEDGGVPRQPLLIPEIVELAAAECERLIARADE